MFIEGNSLCTLAMERRRCFFRFFTYFFYLLKRKRVKFTSFLMKRFAHCVQNQSTPCHWIFPREFFFAVYEYEGRCFCLGESISANIPVSLFVSLLASIITCWRRCFYHLIKQIVELLSFSSST